MSEPPAPPRLTMVRGEPTAAELAAVVVVLSARGRQPAAGPAGPARSQWAARSRQLRPQLTPGPGAWRASALPR